MLLSAIDLASLEDKTSKNRWGAGTARDRHLYRDDTLWYKIWGREFLEKSPCAVGAQFQGVSPAKQPHGFEIGLFTPEISAAFVDYIRDETGAVRGYITRAGEHVDNPPGDFIRAVFESCVRTGWVFSDLSRNNVVLTGGQTSLIDFDTHLVSLEHLDIAFEEARGALRPHVFPLFVKLIRDHVATRQA